MKNLKNLRKFWSNKKVFITGHTGFKGTWICIILNFLHAKIYGYSLKPNKNSFFFKANILEFISSNTFGDINNYKNLKKKITASKASIIIHMAAQPLVLESYKYPKRTFETNVMGTLNLLEAVREIKTVKSIIIVTTDKVYKAKKSNSGYIETDELWGSDPYSSSKVGTEIVTSTYIKSFFINTHLKNRVSTVRAGNVLGGGDDSKNRLIPDIHRSINKKKKLIIRNPNNIRPWQHVIEPLFGYLKLAKMQFKGFDNNHYYWNFGPEQQNFKRVIDVVKLINKKHNLNYKIKKQISVSETNILKLKSLRAKKELKWQSKWNVDKTLIKIEEWNNLVKLGKSVKRICEKQISDYLK